MKCIRWRSNRSKSVNEHLILREHQDWPIADVLCADDTLLCVSDGPNSASLRRHIQVIIVNLFCLSSLPVTSCPVSALPVVEVHDKVTNNKLGVCSHTRRPNTHYYSIFYSLIWMMSSQGLKPCRLLCEKESQTEEKWRKASLVSDKGWALNHAELLC